MWSVSCSLCSWSAVEDTLPSMAQEQCCSVLILPRRAFCVWRGLPRVAWGSWGGAERDPGDTEPRGAGRGQVAVLPGLSLPWHRAGSGTRGTPWHGVPRLLLFAPFPPCCPSVVIVAQKRSSSRAGRAGRAAGHGRAAGCASCAWHSAMGWATTEGAGMRGRRVPRATRATALLPLGTGHCQPVPMTSVFNCPAHTPMVDVCLGFLLC